MAKKAPKKNQKEKPLEVDMTPDELLELMGGSSPVTKKQLQEHREAKEKKKVKEEGKKNQ